MSQDQIYRLQDYATLDLVEEDTDEPTPVAGLQDVEVVAAVSIETLYTADSIKPADKLQNEAVVNVEIGYSYFDPDVVNEWLGGEGQSATSWEDDSSPQTYELTGEFMSSDGSQQMSFTVEGITFEEMPLISASQGEFAQWDLSGEGMDISNFEVAEPPE